MDTAVREEPKQVLRVYRAIVALVQERGSATIEESRIRTGLTEQAVSRAYRIIHQVIEDGG